jgi:hypothetical protein
LTELHGGSVQVESTLGKGSCFTIVLPWNKTYVIKDGQERIRQIEVRAFEKVQKAVQRGARELEKPRAELSSPAGG